MRKGGSNTRKGGSNMRKGGSKTRKKGSKTRKKGSKTRKNVHQNETGPDRHNRELFIILEELSQHK